MIRRNVSNKIVLTKLVGNGSFSHVALEADLMISAHSTAKISCPHVSGFQLKTGPDSETRSLATVINFVECFPDIYNFLLKKSH